MKELKFRFIDKGDGTVYKPITLKELCLRIEIPRRIILESKNGDFVDTDDFLDLLEKDELIAEQYTGHEDKNGKEICEGDVVEYDWYIIGDKPAYRTKEKVAFNDMGARVGNDRIRNCTNVEVIGNIHENPELLEKKK